MIGVLFCFNFLSFVAYIKNKPLFLFVLRNFQLPTSSFQP